MHRRVAVPWVLVVVVLSACTSTAPAPSRSTSRPFENVRRIAVVASGDTAFAVNEHRAEPGRTFRKILKSGPFESWWQPLADLVHRGINWLLDVDRTSEASAGVSGVSPHEIVSAAFGAALAASGQFDAISLLSREPVGDDRRRADAIVRLTVPAWGLVRVREGEPDLHSAFADVRAEMALRGTGVAVWQQSEDVTDLERLPLTAFTGDREFTRQQLIDVLQRAGQRLASELLYARSAGR